MFEFHCLENWLFHLLLSGKLAPMSELWYHMYMLPSLHHIHMIKCELCHCITLLSTLNKETLDHHGISLS